MTEPWFPVLSEEADVRQIAPTDVAQFIRLEQCERYLRLRMHARLYGDDFMREYGVRPQSIPPLLSRSGATFEARVEAAVRERAARSGGAAAVRNCATEQAREGRRRDDNELVLASARELGPGRTLTLLQPRLLADVAGWRIRGDVDILQLERDADGRLHALIADMKSTTATKVEHRLQVAFYHEMLAALCASAGIECASITLALLYRGPVALDGATDEERERHLAQRAAAERRFGVSDALLEVIDDRESYLGAVDDLVTGPHSAAMRVASTPFDELNYHLTYKCDGCLYNELCMTWAATHDDLSLLPHLTQHDKGALRRNGIRTTRALAALLEPAPEDREHLQPASGQEALAARLSATWPVGPRLDELVHRARRYRRWLGEPVDALSWIPSRGYGSLPYVAPDHNPNLVRVYVDAQHDYLHDRIYLLGALLVGCEGGEEQPQRRRSVVHMTDGPPDAPAREEELFVRWIGDVLRALREVAAPDEQGEPKAPIHLIFYNQFEQRLLLDGLARHFARILGATPLYDFMTQVAAFDSSLVTYLDQEIRERKNYPMVCQSLQAVAGYLRFDWNSPEPYRELFRVRMFDDRGKLEESGAESGWYTSRARFNSQIPLEYAYAAWGELETPEGADDDYARFRGLTPEQIAGFHARRLEALEHVARDFAGNRQTQKTPFDILDLTLIDGKARSLAQALDEFVTIEQHVGLGAWRAARNAAPETRVRAGETLLVRYVEAEQEPGVGEQNRENERRRQLNEQYRATYREANPDAPRVNLPREQREASKWSQDGMRFWLRVETDGTGCGLEEVLGLTTFKEGDTVVVSPRWTVDSRLAPEEQVSFTPTPKQMLYGTRARLERLQVERDANERAVAARVLVRMEPSRNGRPGYVWGGRSSPFLADERYMLDPDPNNWMGSHAAGLTEGLLAGQPHALYERLTDPAGASVAWPDAAARGQRRFLEGLDALHAAGALHDFEPNKRAYIGEHGAEPVLLVQGPPGTGKSYSTAFAIFARLQGALAAGIPYRVFVSCKTHAAVDVLMRNLGEAQEKLRELSRSHPAIFGDYFDEALLHIPMMRYRPSGAVECPVVAVPRDGEKAPDAPPAYQRLMAHQWCVVGATPGGMRGLIVDQFGTRGMFGNELCDCLVLDEASQMNLPEALLAGLGLRAAGQAIVVGDHRQMPPIVAHDWANERRRTFHEYRAYDSLFDWLRMSGVRVVPFEESFRLHRDMAEFLRRQIYVNDGILFHSKREAVLPPLAHDDPFVAAVLAPEHPIVVVVHDEAASQQRNDFERDLMRPALEFLAEEYALDPVEGLGVVVPHRAQRASLREGIRCLTKRGENGEVEVSAVDTVERFQGDERVAIVYSATESDPQYLISASKFLMDPRRLTVALSRAKSKVVVVAARSVFTIFSADEETFRNAQLWKDLLRRTCTMPLWAGERQGVRVEVWGNPPLARVADETEAQAAAVR